MITPLQSSLGNRAGLCLLKKKKELYRDIKYGIAFQFPSLVIITYFISESLYFLLYKRIIYWKKWIVSHLTLEKNSGSVTSRVADMMSDRIRIETQIS